jgi:uncharacterized protein
VSAKSARAIAAATLSRAKSQLAYLLRAAHGIRFAAGVSRPDFIVPLADLERGPRKTRFVISEAWLRNALEGTEATPSGPEGDLSLELTKNGREVMVRGSARVSVSMPSARTLRPVSLEITPEIFLLLAPAEPVEAKPRRRRRGPAASATLRSAEARGRREAPAAKGRGGGWAEDPALGDDEAARDTYSGEQIILDPFVREFIVLELPMVPLLQDEEEQAAGLRSSEDPAIRPPSSAGDGAPIDPRLRPLAEIASRLRSKE